MAKSKKKEEPKEIPVTPVARIYMNMVEDSIRRIEASIDRPSTEQKLYLEALRENVRRAPKWFLNNKTTSHFSPYTESSGNTESVENIIEEI